MQLSSSNFDLRFGYIISILTVSIFLSSYTVQDIMQDIKLMLQRLCYQAPMKRFLMVLMSHPWTVLLMFNLPGNMPEEVLWVSSIVQEAPKKESDLTSSTPPQTFDSLWACWHKFYWEVKADGMIHNMRLIGWKVSSFPAVTFWFISYQDLISDNKWWMPSSIREAIRSYIHVLACI